MCTWEQSLDKISSNSLLVSIPKQTIIRFYCPIPAECIQKIANHQPGDPVHIEGIYQKRSSELLYMIDGLTLPHHYFKLTIQNQ